MKPLSILFALLLTACAIVPTAPRMNALSVGMTKAQVIAVMGRPVSTSALGDGTEQLIYELTEKPSTSLKPYTKEYRVILRNGLVTAYGSERDLR